MPPPRARYSATIASICALVGGGSWEHRRLWLIISRTRLSLRRRSTWARDCAEAIEEGLPMVNIT